MPPKKLEKLKKRHSGDKCFGPSAKLPDDGDLFTMRDVLAASERELKGEAAKTSLATFCFFISRPRYFDLQNSFVYPP